METAVPRARSGNLTAALIAISLLELVVNRLAGRLFFPRATLAAGGSGSSATHILATVGPFLFQLTAVLALAVLVVAFAGLLRRGELFPGAMRFSVVVIALVFAAFAGQALLSGHMPPQFFFYLETSFAFLALLIAAAFARSAAPRRIKVGVALFALPGFLHALSVVGPVLGPGLGAGWLRGASSIALMAGAGELALLAAAIAAPFSLSPRPFRERRRGLPLAVAGGLTAALVAAIGLRFDLMQASVLYGLRIDLPRLDSIAGLLHVAAFFGWSYATVQLVADKGGMRLAGYGLLLLALGGYEAGSPVELSLSLLGLLALAVGELRALPYADRSRPRVPTGEWRAFIGRLATAMGDGSAPDETPPDAVVVEEGELEVSRMRTHRRGAPVSVRLLRRRGIMAELEAAVGDPGHRAPDASVERHRRWLARSPEHRLKLPRVKTGDASFDQKFSVHGPAPLRDPELRARLARRQGDGVTTLWKATAARYQLASPAAPVQTLPIFQGTVEGEAPVATILEILDLLADLIEASTT